MGTNIKNTRGQGYSSRAVERGADQDRSARSSFFSLRRTFVGPHEAANTQCKRKQTKQRHCEWNLQTLCGVRKKITAVDIGLDEDQHMQEW